MFREGVRYIFCKFAGGIPHPRTGETVTAERPYSHISENCHIGGVVYKGRDCNGQLLHDFDGHFIFVVFTGKNTAIDRNTAFYSIQAPVSDDLTILPVCRDDPVIRQGVDSGVPHDVIFCEDVARRGVNV